MPGHELVVRLPHRQMLPELVERCPSAGPTEPVNKAPALGADFEHRKVDRGRNQTRRQTAGI